jgi:hypothetical protein
MKTYTTSIVNTTLIVAGNRSADSSNKIMKEFNRKVANDIQKRSEEYQKKKAEKEYAMKHGSLNQAINAFFTLT